MDDVQTSREFESSCAVCGALVFCQYSNSGLCNDCDALIHNTGSTSTASGRPYMSGARGAHGEEQLCSARFEGFRRPKNTASKTQVLNQTPDGVADTGPAERSSTDSDMLRADDLLHWNPPNLHIDPSDDLFQVNTIEHSRELEIFLGASAYDLPRNDSVLRQGNNDTGPIAFAEPRSHGLAHLMKTRLKTRSSKDSAECKTSSAEDGSSHETNLYTPTYTSHPPAVAPVWPGTWATPAPGPLPVPIARNQSREQVCPGTPPAGEAMVTMHNTQAAAPVVCPRHPAAAQAMPHYMPQQMMQPMMMWPGGGCFMPMYQHDAWAMYMPATLQPRADPAAHRAHVQARRAKIARFLEKKRLMSCATPVRYASRKRYADARPRVHGRFISKSAAASAAAGAAAAAGAG